MRYRVKWQKNGREQHLLIREAAPAGAISFAYTLLTEARPADIWIETEEGRLVADYAAVIEEGPIYSASTYPSPLEERAPKLNWCAGARTAGK